MKTKKIEIIMIRKYMKPKKIEIIIIRKNMKSKKKKNSNKVKTTKNNRKKIRKASTAPPTRKTRARICVNTSRSGGRDSVAILRPD